MWNSLTWCLVTLAMASVAVGEDPQSLQPGKPRRENDAGGMKRAPPKQLAVDLGGGVKMEFILIPAGSFLMGDEKGGDWEKPVHKVTITKPFYLGKYETTQAEWEAVMGTKPHYVEGPKHPVHAVSSGDCLTFLEKLNAKLRAEGAKFSLPTEAQWEYACRAGSTLRWGFGDDSKKLGDYAWWAANANGMTHPVGQKKPNAWGLYDMQGNVWEWCADGFADDYYAKSPANDPLSPDTGGDRVVRGGSWGRDVREQYFRCAARSTDHLTSSSRGPIGFRLVRTVAP